MASMDHYYIQQEEKKKYLCRDEVVDNKIDPFTVGVLQNRTIPGLAFLQWDKKGEKQVLKYDISYGIPINKYLEDGVEEENLVRLFFSITRIVLRCNEKMVNYQEIIWNMEGMFINPYNQKLMLIHTLGQEQAERVDFCSIFNQLLKVTKIEANEQNVKAFLLNYLKFQTILSIEEFNVILNNMLSKLFDIRQSSSQLSLSGKLDGDCIHIDEFSFSNRSASEYCFGHETMEDKGHLFGGNSSNMYTFSTEVTAGLSQNGLEKKEKNSAPVLMEEKDNSLETKKFQPAYIVRLKTRERVPIVKPIFRLGKEKYLVDYFIPDNAAVSRCHAMIIYRDCRYYIRDTNSTNHTFVNNIKLCNNDEIEINNGAKIILGNEEFYFQYES